MKEKVSIITGASGEIGQNLILRYSKLKNKKIIFYIIRVIAKYCFVTPSSRPS